MEEEIGKTAGAIGMALKTRGEMSLSESEESGKREGTPFDLALGGWRRETSIAIHAQEGASFASG